MSSSIKYLIKNIHSFICESGFVAVMTFITVMTASIIINFSYGLYQNFNIVIKEEAGGTDYMSIYFLNKGTKEGEYVSKKKFMDCIFEIAGYEDKLDEKFVAISTNGYIDGDEYEFNFNIRNGSIGISDTFVNNIKSNGMFTGGIYWSDIDEQEGSCVALCYDKTRFDNDSPILDRIQTDENTLTIDGKKYKIIGYQIWVDDGAMIPIQSTNDDICIENVIFGFDRGLTKETFNRISETFTNHLGDLVYIEKLPVIDKDSFYTYKTIIIISFLITIIAGFDFLILYKYITDKRSKRTAIYRLCGMPRTKIMGINFAECMLLTIPLYLFGMIIFDKLLLPNLTNYFPYMKSAYSSKLYFLLFGIYTCISIIICGFMIIYENKKTIIEQLNH